MNIEATSERFARGDRSLAPLQAAVFAAEFVRDYAQLGTYVADLEERGRLALSSACDLVDALGIALDDDEDGDTPPPEPDPRPNFDGLSEQAAAARALHWLWGQAKDLPGYDKPLWMRLQRVVERRDAACGGES